MSTSNKAELDRLNREAVEISRRAASQAEESTVVGRRTVTAMEQQTETLTRLNMETEDTHAILKRNKKIMRDMNRCWFTRLFCSGSIKRGPSPTKWHGERQRVDDLLKAKTKDKWLAKDKSQAVAAQQDLSTPDCTLSIPEIPHRGYCKSKTKPGTDGEDGDADAVVEAQLGRLESAVEELRGLAAEISVQSAVQQRLTEDLAEGVERTRQGVRENEQTFHKVAPQLKRKNKDEYMDVADKILIRSATASLKHKVGASI